MRILSWEECTKRQKFWRVVLGLPFAMATAAYLIVGMWMFYVLIKY